MILPLNMWGQNLVMNGSAEIINTCNLTSGYIGNASGWYSPNNSSPDVLNECSNNPFYAIPNNQLGYRFAMEGKGYLGIYNSSNLDESIQIYEYISTKLEKSLKPEYKYCISFYVALGQKDAQQVSVLKKVIKDLNFPIHIKVGPIIREMDGLAMSSRNTYLNPDERRDALLLNQSNELATRLVKSGINDVEIILKEIRELLTSVGSIKIDYVEIVNKHTLEDESIVISEQSMLMLAVWVNEVRLIDNKVL